MQGVTYKWTASTRIKVAAAASIEQASDDPARTFLASKWIGGGGDNDKAECDEYQQRLFPLAVPTRGRAGLGTRESNTTVIGLGFGALPSSYISKDIDCGCQLRRSIFTREH